MGDFLSVATDLLKLVSLRIWRIHRVYNTLEGLKDVNPTYNKSFPAWVKTIYPLRW